MNVTPPAPDSDHNGSSDENDDDVNDILTASITLNDVNRDESEDDGAYGPLNVTASDNTLDEGHSSSDSGDGNETSFNTTSIASDNGHRNRNDENENDEVHAPLNATPAINNASANGNGIDTSFNATPIKSDDADQNAENTLDKQFEHNSNSGRETIASSEVDDLHTDNNSSELQSNAEEFEAKNTLASVPMSDEDQAAISNLLCVCENVSDENVIAGLSLHANEKAEIKDGKIYVTKALDSSLEMVYVYGEQAKPKPPLYNVKINDVISSNLPFKENVSKIKL